MSKIYTDEEIKTLINNPNVYYASRNRVALSLEFKQKMYDEWVKVPNTSSIRKFLYENGFDNSYATAFKCRTLSAWFKRYGRPKITHRPSPLLEMLMYGISFRNNTFESESEHNPEGYTPTNDECFHKESNQCTDKKNLIADQPTQEEYNMAENLKHNSNNPIQQNKFSISSTVDLIFSGKFYLHDNEIQITPEFEKELLEKFPAQSVEEGLIAAGINPEIVDYHLIYRLEENFRQRLNIESGHLEPIYQDVEISEHDQRFLSINPYVQSVNDTEINLGDNFYHAAAVLKDMDIDDILGIFFINHELLKHDDKMTIADRLEHTDVMADNAWMDCSKTVLDLLVLHRRERALSKIVETGYENIASSYKALSCLQKKNLCLWIESLPKDPSHIFTKHDIMRRIGIPRSIYYRYVNDKDFGTGEIKRMNKDKDDAELIRYVFEYKGFKKGYRQVYMLLPRLTGKKIGLQRVRKLMKANGLESGVRGPNPNRQRALKHEADTVKPNLLRRRFRNHRPNKVRVTDVTYLDYGHGTDGKPLRAYGSALMDPVTSRLFAFDVSENNDLDLALKTLHALDDYPCIDGGIFHSDQGVLYKTADFQDEVLRHNLRQSMSKKGNCWDNATQESFFGHFKDECDYSICKTIEDLRNRVTEFVDYYNNERGLWDRKHMTPIEYEDYLLSMSDEEFEYYLAAEEERYIRMKIRAAELAKKRYGTLGV